MRTANSTASLLSGTHLAVGLVLAGRQDVVQHRAHLCLAPAAARLHVGEQPLDVADLRGDRLHVAHRLLHRGELVDHPVEALVHLLLHRGVELLVHRLLDFRELRLIAVAHLAQLALQHRADAFEVCADLLALLTLLARQSRAGGLRLAARAGHALFREQAQALQHAGLPQHDQQCGNRRKCRDNCE